MLDQVLLATADVYSMKHESLVYLVRTYLSIEYSLNLGTWNLLKLHKWWEKLSFSSFPHLDYLPLKHFQWLSKKSKRQTYFVRNIDLLDPSKWEVSSE